MIDLISNDVNMCTWLAGHSHSYMCLYNVFYYCTVIITLSSTTIHGVQINVDVLYS